MLQSLSLPPQPGHRTIYAIRYLLGGELIVISHLAFESGQFFFQGGRQSFLTGLTVQVVKLMRVVDQIE